MIFWHLVEELLPTQVRHMNDDLSNRLSAAINKHGGSVPMVVRPGVVYPHRREKFVFYYISQEEWAFFSILPQGNKDIIQIECNIEHKHQKGSLINGSFFSEKLNKVAEEFLLNC